MSVDLRTWWDQGDHLDLAVRGESHEVFVWTDGPADAPWITLLHGWPTSSWDWSHVAPALAERRRVIAPDLLGLGASAKGDDVPYDIASQASMVEALWSALGVDETTVVAHDVGTIVTQELLARRLDSDTETGTRISDITWLNGSLDPSAYRPTDAQQALLDPELGPALVTLIDEATFCDGLAAVHHNPPDPAVLQQHWRAMARDDGHLGTHRFLQYIPERARNADRLLGAVTRTATPMRFVWGLADPVSGAEQLTALRRRLPGLDAVELPDAGHYPATEDPEAVLTVLRNR